MKIAVICANGKASRLITKEAVDRGTRCYRNCKVEERKRSAKNYSKRPVRSDGVFRLSGNKRLTAALHGHRVHAALHTCSVVFFIRTILRLKINLLMTVCTSYLSLTLKVKIRERAIV